MDRAMPIYLSPSSLNFLLGSQHTCHFESWQVREWSGWKSINHNENCEESKGIFCPSPTLPDIAPTHAHPGELCRLEQERSSQQNSNPAVYGEWEPARPVSL